MSFNVVRIVNNYMVVKEIAHKSFKGIQFQHKRKVKENI